MEGENQQPQTDRKALKIFGIESVIIVILIIVILGVLSFLGIIPVRSILPGLFGAKPTPTISNPGYFDPVRAQQLKQAKDINPNLPADIEIVSDIPSLTASISQKDELIKLLRSWNVYGRTYDPSVYASGSLGGKPLENIVIHITTQTQAQNKYSNDNGKTVYSSSYARFSPGTMDLLIQVDPTKPDTLPQQVMFQLTNMLTKMTKPVDGKVEIIERDAFIRTRYNEVINDSSKYFSISQ